jgi:trans-aconitate methyltransferase
MCVPCRRNDGFGWTQSPAWYAGPSDHMTAPGWTESDSATYTAIADVAVPRRREMVATILAAVPFARHDAFRVVELGCGDGHLGETLLDAFPSATLLALDGSEHMQRLTSERLARFGSRAQVRAFALDTLDWWDLMHGADLVVSSLCLHHLNDAKKQYVYKAIASRLSARGALIVADVIDPMHSTAREAAADAWEGAAREQAEAIGRPDLYARFVAERWNLFRFPDAIDKPSALFHHLVWLKHAGFDAVECLWLYGGHAVFAGYMPRRQEDATPI